MHAFLQTRRMREARAETAATRAQLQEMEIAYDQAPLGMTVLDRDLRYVRTNRMLAEQNGLAAEEHLGKSIREVVPDVADMAEPIFQDVMRSGVPLIGVEFEGATKAHPTAVRAYRESVYPVRDRHGLIVGVSVAVEDVTETRRLLAALHDSEQRERMRATELQSVMDATPAAIFIAHDRACLNVTSNAEAVRLLRLGAEQSPSLSDPGPHSYAAYADGVALRPEELPLQLAAATGREIRGCELEMHFPDGDVLHVLVNAVPLRDHTGQVIGSVAAFVDITAQKNASEELKRQARHKDEFLAVLAHELRNPLAAIQAGLELLKIEAVGSARLARTHQIMQRQMAHVVRLIDDLLDVARISSGKLELSPETASVREIVDAAIELSRGHIERGGHRFHAELPPEPLFLHVDRVRLTEVVSNLLHNAAKYTPSGGAIDLTVLREQGEVVIRVTDNGVGIAPENMPQVFTMFAQAEDARAQRRGGLGVGLALARRIVELHGGQIGVASAGPGKGSTFSVRLPVAPAPAPAAGEGPAERAAAQASLRILVLDDNADAASTLGAMLEAHGHIVRLAFTGAGALEVLDKFSADLAFLDIGLPDISGYEVARRVRQRFPERDIFLAALSGWGSTADRRQSEEAGIDVHLTKPVTMATIENVIQSRQLRAGLAGQPS
nr:ATP-binding protein [Massilia terrae]